MTATPAAARPTPATRVQGLAAWLGGAVRFWYVFTRFPVIGVSALMPLLGAASLNPRPSAGQVFGLLGVALAFHNFAYVFNDVVDLPVDRTEPLRAKCPLVQGTVKPWQALAFAGLMAPLAFGLTAWQGGPLRAYLALGAGFALMAAYDLWGKRTRFPPLTDLVQALGWGAYTLYGAAMMPGPFNHLTVVVVAFVVVYILMVNGVHGSLRDLKNDYDCGMRSTALLLGARPRGEGVTLPWPLAAYTLALQAGLIALTAFPLASNDLGYPPPARALTAAAVLGSTLFALYWLRAAARRSARGSPMIIAGAMHIALTLSCVVVLFACRAAPGLLAVMVVIYLAPLLLHQEILEGARHRTGRLLAAARTRQRPA
jgi:4-hydroxybenzoate polyprenyltransferase